MPEGDTVWLAARTLHDALAGNTLTRSDFRVPQLATLNLTGHTVTDVSAYGKHLFFEIDGCGSLHTHFRMDGSWHLYDPGARWRGGPSWQIRAILSTAKIDAVGYRLPVIELLDEHGRRSLIDRLGPDLLDDDLDLTDAARRLAATDPERAIGEALLDQRIIAGLGLIYVTETLFLEGLTPWTRVGDVSQFDRLIATGVRLMRANRGHYIQTTTGDHHRDRWHYVYERTGKPCRRCGDHIAMAWQGRPGYERLAYWCPRCQRGPHPSPMTRQDRAGLRTVGRSRYRP
jgi:endonuclease VIII